MFETEHLHQVETRDHKWVCIDIVRLAGQVISVSWYIGQEQGRHEFDYREH